MESMNQSAIETEKFVKRRLYEKGMDSEMQFEKP